jgi:hypothetical protein
VVVKTTPKVPPARSPPWFAIRASKGGKAVLEKYGREYLSKLPERREINRKSRDARFARVKKIMRFPAA